MISGIKRYLAKELQPLLVKGSFAQNFAIFFSGTAINFLVAVLLSPITARIYGPDAYGILSIVTAIVLNISIVATLMYTQAIVLPDEEDKVFSLFQLLIILSLFFSLLTLLVILFFEKELKNKFNLELLGYWIYLIPPAVFIVSMNRVMSNWVLRVSAYKEYTKVNSGVQLGGRVSSIVYGIALSGPVLGLVLTDFITRLVELVFIVKITFKNSLKKIFSNYSKAKVVSVAKEYKNYPIYILPAEYLNVISDQIPLYLFTMHYGTSTVGSFAFAINILNIPNSLLGNTIRPVFLQKAKETFQTDPEKLKVITLALYKKLLLLGLIPFSILTIFGDKIFVTIFGEKWVEAGIFAGLLGNYFIFLLTSSPMVGVFFILKKEKLLMCFNAFLFLVKTVSLLLGIFVFKNDVYAITAYSVANSFAFFLLSIVIFKLVNLPYIKTPLITLAQILSVFLILYIVRIYLYDEKFLFF